MPKFYTKNVDKVPTTVDLNYISLESSEKKIINCAICGKVEVPSSYIVYKFNGKDFCSWNCKSKYRKAHPEEVEITESEKAAEKLIRTINRQNNQNDTTFKKHSKPVPYVCYVDGVKYDSIAKASIAVFDSSTVIPTSRRKFGDDFVLKGHHIKVIPVEVEDE